MMTMTKERDAVPALPAPDLPASTMTIHSKNGTLVVGMYFRQNGKDTLQSKAEHLLTEEYLGRKSN